jgi:Phage DNA packaging protein, Nu1 subunit of terminase
MATQSQCAKHIFLSLDRLKKLIDKGAITRQDPGQYDLDQVRKEYIENLRAVFTTRGTSVEQGIDLTRERARLAKEQADAQQMKNDMQRGDLVEINDVTKTVEEQFLATRAKLLALPTKYGPIIHASADSAEAQEVLREAIVEALDELVGYNKGKAEELSGKIAEIDDRVRDASTAGSDSQ